MAQVDLNSVSVEQMVSRLGFSEEIAKRVAGEREQRPFLSVEQLAERVKGVEELGVERLRRLVRFGSPPGGPVRVALHLAGEIMMSPVPRFRHSWAPPPFGDGFEEPPDDLPRPTDKDWDRFWDMYRRKSGGLEVKGTITGSWPDMQDPPNGCTYVGTNYYTYTMDRKNMCHPYQSVYTIMERNSAGGGVGGSAAGFGASVAGPNFYYEVMEDRVGLRYEYELRAAIIEDVYDCSGLTRVKLFSWYMGWGLVKTVDPAVCSSRVVRTFESEGPAEVYRDSLGGLKSFPSLGIEDDY